MTETPEPEPSTETSSLPEAGIPRDSTSESLESAAESERETAVRPASVPDVTAPLRKGPGGEAFGSAEPKARGTPRRCPAQPLSRLR